MNLLFKMIAALSIVTSTDAMENKIDLGEMKTKPHTYETLTNILDVVDVPYDQEKIKKDKVYLLNVCANTLNKLKESQKFKNLRYFDYDFSILGFTLIDMTPFEEIISGRPIKCGDIFPEDVDINKWLEKGYIFEKRTDGFQLIGHETKLRFC